MLQWLFLRQQENSLVLTHTICLSLVHQPSRHSEQLGCISTAWVRSVTLTPPLLPFVSPHPPSGGGLWHTWLDRDLSIAGRVITASKDAQGTTSYSPHLVHIRKPLVRIPTVAIHLDRNQNEKFFYNQETGMQAILGTITEQVTGTQQATENTKNKDALDISANHHPKLLELIAQELSTTLDGPAVKAENIHDFELSLCDHQPPTLGGVNEEFIFSPRLDNLFSSFCAVDGMTEWVQDKKEIPEGAINMFVLYDNEEIGSLSTFGAESNFLPATMERIVGKPELLNESIARSFMLSVDQGHALHPAPDHVAKHQAEHRPLMNGGPAIKTNAKVRSLWEEGIGGRDPPTKSVN